jgi:hypothetical protein
LVGKRYGKGHYKDLGLNVGIILIRISKKRMGGSWTGLTSLRIEQVADFCEHGNEHSVSIKCEEFIE